MIYAFFCLLNTISVSTATMASNEREHVASTLADPPSLHAFNIICISKPDLVVFGAPVRQDWVCGYR